MRRPRYINPNLKLELRYEPELKVIRFISTQKGDPERGPLIRMRGSEARFRLVQDGELVWVKGPRRQDLAVVVVDDSLPEGSVVLRDVAGVAVSEKVKVMKPDLDNTPRQVG